MRKFFSVHVLVVFAMFVSLLSPMYAFAETDKPTSSVQLLSVEDTEEGTKITWVTTVDSELPKEDGTFYLQKNEEQVEIPSPTVVEEVVNKTLRLLYIAISIQRKTNNPFPI